MIDWKKKILIDSPILLKPRFLLPAKEFFVVLSPGPVYGQLPWHIHGSHDLKSHLKPYHVPEKVRLVRLLLFFVYAPYVAIALKSFTDGTFAPFVFVEVSTIFTLKRENNIAGEYV